MKNKIRVALSIFLIAACFSTNAQSTWPKEIPFKNGGKVTIYQPQPESFEGNKLTGRSAVSVNETAKSEPVFGAIFYDAFMSTDKDSRTADLDSITITNAKFTGVDDQTKIDKLIAFIEAEVPKWKMEISLDALVASIKRDHPNAEMYNNDPPKIIYTTKPTTLVVLDGEPKIQKDKDLDAERVINSPSLIFKEGSQWNMYNGGIWYKSADVINGWTAEKTMSKKVISINDQIKKQEKENNDGKAVTDKPAVTDIIVSTVPAELIQSNGVAVYTVIDSTSLSYISNSANNIFKDNNTQSIYILIAGRWYKSTSLNGPWTYNEPDKMPVDFSNIPEGSAKDNVLASIAGTDAADEAMIDAEIPQTAKVDRKTATVKVVYDGEPTFKTIDGTSLQLAENTSLTVLRESADKYFALDNGVWFVGTSANGPWTVATERPKEVENIPAKSAAYNSKFVHIYEVAADYTVQGYTAGYLGSYIQGDPVIVFGTGYYYTPWFGSIFYPRACTWGYGFSYNPWTGWSMSYGFNVRFMHIGFYFGGGGGYGGGGWFGPPMYRPPYYHPPYGGGGWYGNRGGGNRPGFNRPGGNTNINIIVNNRRNNLYNNIKGVSTKNNNRSNNPGKINTISRDKINSNKGNAGNTKNNYNRPLAKPGKTENNIFSDKQGNIFQRNKNGDINQRDNNVNKWKPTPNKQIPERQILPIKLPNTKLPDRQNPNNQRPIFKRPERQPAGTINRDIQMRDRGNTRDNNFNQSQNRVPAKRPFTGNGVGQGGGKGLFKKR